jgi:hypothetical protein
MPAVALAARVVLALALALAAVAKLRTPEQVRVQTTELIGARYGTVIARALPFVELGIAVALIVWWTAAPGIAAAGLLVLFTLVLVRAQARRLPCPCFGAGGSAKAVGPLAILRNGILLAYAVLATASPSGAAFVSSLAAILVLGAIGAGALAVS